MTDDYRSDNNIRHFVSRSQQPKILAISPQGSADPSKFAVPVNNSVVYDQGFGGHSAEIDDLRFKYMGVSPKYSQYETMDSRRTGQNNMHHSFNY